jgi:hypothetical protein
MNMVVNNVRFPDQQTQKIVSDEVVVGVNVNGHFDGDIDGLFMVDEFLTSPSINTVFDNMLEGLHFTDTVCPFGQGCTTCPTGMYKSLPDTVVCMNYTSGQQPTVSVATLCTTNTTSNTTTTPTTTTTTTTTPTSTTTSTSPLVWMLDTPKCIICTRARHTIDSLH